MHGSIGGRTLAKRRTTRFITSVLLCALPCFHTFCESVEYRPWIGNYYEFEFRNSMLYQSYPAIACDSSLHHASSDDFFLSSSLSNAVDPSFSLEAEVVAAKTRKQCWGIDHFNLAGRLVWLDDISGDCITLTTGFVLTQTFDNSLSDISSFHHGTAEAEFFLSFGAETMWEDDDWVERWWGMTGIGIGDRGSPWLHGQYAYERRFCTNHEFLFRMNTLWGLGNNKIRIHDFHGYGSIQHQSIDLGIRYTYLIDFFGNASVDYSYRIYARNFPAQTHQILVSLLYTFGL